MNPAALLYASISAALFGLSTPAAKILLDSVHPAILAGLFYCGAGIGIKLLRRSGLATFFPSHAREAALGWPDIPWLAGAVLCGGIAGPILLMFGLAQTSAATASLLLTLEGTATTFIAVLIFRENYGPRLLAGLAFLIGGAALLAWSGAPSLESVIGPLAIVGACVAWGIDNNLTRKVSLADPLQIVEIKGLVAGPANLMVGFWAGGSFPTLTTSLLGAAVGFIGYGISLVLFVLALRDLGTARTSAYFAAAPFLGAVGAVVALGEPVSARLVLAGGLMAIGVWLHLSERHEHEHMHGVMRHAHSHMHDAHHQHPHDASDPSDEPHVHVHQHGPLKHTHPHTPDMHHEHRHE